MIEVNWPVFVAASLLLITPGQDVILVMSRSIAQGAVAGVATATGVCTGLVVHTVVAALGLSALIRVPALRTPDARRRLISARSHAEAPPEQPGGRGPDDSALLGSPCEELSWLVMNGFTATSRAAQMSSFMLGDVFDMLENLAALRATISVRRHRASPM